MLVGLDASNNNEQPLDWAEAALDSVEFGLYKSGEGLHFQDPTFPVNWAALKAAGLKRGAYHFARADQGNDPAAEARYMLAAITAGGGLEAGDVLALDMEMGSGDQGPWALTFLQTLEGAAGFTPWIYADLSYIQTHLSSTPELARYPLWLAAWGMLPAQAPAPWSTIACWQWSERAYYSGIGPCDGDHFLGDATTWARLAKPAATPVPPTPAPLPGPPTLRYRVVTETYLRLVPRLQGPFIVLLPVGAEVQLANTPHGGPNVTTHWLCASDAAGHVGWLYRSNLQGSA